MKRTLSAFLALMLLVICSFSAFAQDNELSLSAQAYVLYCSDNGQVILSSNMNEQLPMASTTKIMTALIALEYAQENDRSVEFTDKMTSEGSSMYLKVGDVVKLSDLAAGMMTVSGNDAANAVAITLGGSTEKFAEMMNKRARDIGMKNTNFTNPSGLPDDNHMSTAYDMALLMAEAMKNEAFSKLTKQKSVTVDFIKPAHQSVTYSNHNRLLSMYEYCTGGKTGYTKASGRCLVTSAVLNNLSLVAVTLNDKNDWQDHIALFEYGFEKFGAVTASDAETSYSVKVMGSKESVISAKVEDSRKCVVDAQSLSDVKTCVYIPPVVFAPVKKGDVVGKVICTLDGKVILEKDIVAQEGAQYQEISQILCFFRRLFR